MTDSPRKSALAARLDAINEFDREPVSKDRLRGPGGFIGLYAGEHVAGTEFVIGPLFVVHGVATGDLLLGLLVGNLLAVLSWAFLCAPIATRTRLNLYWRLRKITGPNLLFVYNIVNALMFCFLAGAMISVAATAVGIPFDMPMPGLSDLYPNSAAWVVTVLVALAIQQGGEVAPGPIAWLGAGVAGLIAVVVAGWTTANPTIYRAGLAMQTITPNWKRWKVTLAVGGVTTVAALFPALMMRLLDFVALYGLILMPMGAVIFADFWILPRMGLRSGYAGWKQIAFDWPAALTWIGTLAACRLMHVIWGWDIFFLGLPGWFIATGLFIGLSAIRQRPDRAPLATHP